MENWYYSSLWFPNRSPLSIVKDPAPRPNPTPLGPNLRP